MAFTTQTVLLIDDYLEDRINYARYLLQEIPHYCIIVEAQTGEEGLSICRQQFPDVILLNYDLPDMDGLEFLNKLKTQSNRINFPVIVLTERENSKIAVQVIKSGAVEYLVKNNLTAESLCLAVDSVLEQPFLNARQQPEETLQVYAAELEELYYNAPCGYHSLDADGLFIRINDTELRMLGYSRKELIGKKKMSELLTPESLLIYQENFPRFKERGWVRDLEFQVLRKDGTILPISLSATAVKDVMGNYLYSHSVVVDISERQASLAEDLKDTQLLRNLSAKLLSETDIQVFYGEIVATAIALMQADGGTLQILDEAKQELLLLATQGFEQTMTEHFYRVPASSNTSCGIALATNTRTFVDFDVPKSDDPDGSLRMHADAGYLSAQSTPLITRSGKPIGMVSTHWHKHHRSSDRELRFLDLLARQAADLIEQQAAELIEQRQAELEISKFVSLADNSTEFIGMCDLNFVPFYVNPAGLQMLGLDDLQPYKEIPVKEYFFPEDQDFIIKEFLPRVLREGQAEREIRFRHFKTGEALWMAYSVYCLKDENDQCIGLATTSHNITERKITEQKISEQAALLNIASDAIFVRDLEHNILFWNSGAEHLYGWTAVETQDKKAKELLCQNIVSQMEEILRTVLETGSWRGELQKSTKSGQAVIVSSRMTLVRDEAGQPKSILTVDTDITEKKQLEAQFYQAQRLESLGTMASGIAHDINNILTPILGFAQLLTIKLPNLDEQNRQILEIITSNAKRGAKLVEQILLFSRGELEERVVIQLEHLIKEIERIIKETFPKSIEISSEQENIKGLWTILANPTQIYQVLMNLCINARDAMPNGGKLTIAVENQFFDENYVQMNLETEIGNYVVITISDTGCGMSQEVKEQIFEPFFTTKELGEGTGLGLATVIGIVKSHGGFVHVRSEIGKGSQFQVCLPAIDTEITQENPDSQIVRGNGELILVVDDEASIREVTKKVLISYNYHVLTAHDAVEAFSVYPQHQDAIALVLMDMQMPSLSGLNAIRILRQMNPSLKVIAISGLESNRQLLKDHEIEVQAFLSKPYNINELLDTIHLVLKRL